MRLTASALLLMTFEMIWLCMGPATALPKPLGIAVAVLPILGVAMLWRWAVPRPYRLVAQGEYAAAAAFVRRWLEGDPELLAWILVCQGSPEAEATVRRLLQSRWLKRRPMMQLCLAECLIATGRYAEAEVALSHPVLRRSKPSVTLLRVEILLRGGRGAEVPMAELEGLDAIPIAVALKAWAHAERGDAEGARKAIALALGRIDAANGLSAASCFCLGRAEAGLGNPDAATALYARGAAADPDGATGRQCARALETLV